MTEWLDRCHIGDVRAVLRQMITAGVRVNCIVTSPPYWGLRSYLPEGHTSKPDELGSEPTLGEFLANMTEVFRLAREVLADDGTLWMNMGDSYAGSWGAQSMPTIGSDTMRARQVAGAQRKKSHAGSLSRTPGLKPKDLVGQPWRLAFALQDDGWWLRQDIIWNKPNPMPESVRDRCTKAHEYLFLLSKSASYHFDAESIKEPAVGTNLHDLTGRTKQRGLADTFKRNGSKREQTIPGQAYGTHRPDREDSAYDLAMRNRRSVWTVPTRPYAGAHFATFPPALVEPCILAGCPAGGVVLDIFMGSGTTAQVAQRLGRHWIGIDLDERNLSLQADRVSTQGALVLGAAV